eukprot:3493592-Rhodomonas_salina.2
MGCLVQCQAKLGDDQATVSPDAHDDRYEFTEMTNRRPGLMQRKPTTNPVGMLTRLVRQILPPASDRLRGFVQAVVGNGDRDRLGNLTVGPETLAIDDQAVSRQVQPALSSEKILSSRDGGRDVHDDGAQDRRVDPEKLNTATKASDQRIQPRAENQPRAKVQQSQVISMDHSVAGLVPSAPSDHKLDFPTSSGKAVDDGPGDELKSKQMAALANYVDKHESVDNRRVFESCVEGVFGSCVSSEVCLFSTCYTCSVLRNQDPEFYCRDRGGGEVDTCGSGVYTCSLPCDGSFGSCGSDAICSGGECTACGP